MHIGTHTPLSVSIYYVSDPVRKPMLSLSCPARLYTQHGAMSRVERVRWLPPAGYTARGLCIPGMHLYAHTTTWRLCVELGSASYSSNPLWVKWGTRPRVEPFLDEAKGQPRAWHTQANKIAVE